LVGLVNGGGRADGRSELETIARLALPIALAQFGLTLLGLVDVAVLGHVSAAELGGASIGRSIGFAGLGLGLGAAAALEPLAAQAIGANEPDVAWRSYVATAIACGVIWVPTSVLSLASTWLLVPIGVDAELVAPCRAFLLAQTPGLLLFAVFLASKTFLQAHKRTWPALLAAVIANVVNIVACNALVRGELPLGRLGTLPLGLPPLGAFGAGLASTLSSVVLVGVVLLVILPMRPRTEESGAAKVSVGRVLRLGTPIGFQLLAEIGVFSVVAVLAGKLGKVAVSAHHIAIGLASFTFMGVLGISGATAVRVGHAVGEGRPTRRPGLLGIGIGAAFMACSSAMFLLMPRPLVALFTDDPAVTDLGARLLGIAAAFQLFDGVQGVAAGALRGAGDVRFAFVANVAAHWLIGFPLALVLAFTFDLGAFGLWWGLLAGLVVVSVLLLWRFLKVSRGPLERV
jgi:multidrug resistance protein, MATE family